MKYLPCWLCAWILFVGAQPLWAEQEVVLKSGTSLIGTVSIEGTDVVVQIADKSMRVPLKDVASVGTVNSGHADQARRLLILALEAKLNDKSGKEVVALLAEARRLAPDDPSVLYWCASVLVDAGHGTAARDVFEPKREAIAKVYPGMSDALEKRIKQRMAMEKLPGYLLQRIDSLNAIAAKQTGLEEKRQMFAYFRLVDQNKQPIEQGAFRIESRGGQDENLEGFEDGYFLYVFNRYRGNRDEPCQLDVSEAGLESKTFPFSASNSRVANAGEFVVKRYDEQSKKPIRFRVIALNGEPIANAKITLQMPVRTGQTKDAIATTTGLDGTVEVGAFPAKYFYRVTADGYTYRSGELEVTASGGEIGERELKLHRAIEASVRVAWMTTGNQDGSKTSGEIKVKASGGSAPNVNRYSPDSPPIWVRATQQQNQLQLQFTGPMYGGNQPGADNWMGTIEAGAGASDSDKSRKAQEKFDAVDLNKIDEQKGKAKLRNAGNQPGGVPGAASITADLGSVYVGKMQQRDMRTGRPIVVAFKAIVEEMSADTPGGEK